VEFHFTKRDTENRLSSV